VVIEINSSKGNSLMRLMSVTRVQKGCCSSTYIANESRLIDQVVREVGEGKCRSRVVSEFPLSSRDGVIIYQAVIVNGLRCSCNLPTELENFDMA
jgi:hypothetical protein